MVQRSLWVWALLLSAVSAAAAAEGYSSRVWRTQDGLPNSRVRAITQTSDGYLWVGTAGGLVRFDGVRFVVFDRSNTAEFQDDSILSLVPDRDGSLWIGTEGGGLLHYSNRRFRAFGAAQGLTNGFVRALLRDRDGTLWVGTDRGLFRMRGDAFERLDGSGNLPIVAVSRAHQDRAGRIWFGGRSTLLWANGKLTPLSGALENEGVFTVQQLRDHTLVGLTRHGLRRVNDDFTISKDENLPAGSSVNVLLEDRQGGIWTGSNAEGLSLHRSANTTFRAPIDLPDNTVLALFEDNQGNIWAGTQDGLARFSRKLVDTVVADEVQDITMVYEDRGGTLWLATGAGDLYRRVDGRLSRFRFPRNAEPAVRTMFQDSGGVYWFGTLREGVIRWSNGSMRSYTTREGLRQNSIRAFHEDRHGHLWIGTGSGISRWDGSKFHSYYIEDGLAYGSVRAMTPDHDGNLWVGTDGGLSMIRDGKFILQPWLATFSSERIWAIHSDSDGALWLGTRGRGLYRVHRKTITNYTTRDGLPSNTIHEILGDHSGRLWMSGPAGIFSAGRQELIAFAERRAASFAVTHYSTADGLPSSQMSGGAQPSGCLTSKGEIWFPSVKGAVRVDPEKRRTVTTAPVLVEEIVADGSNIGVDGAVTIPPGPGKLEIHYTAIALLAPERISFKYKLEGFDEDWTTTTRRVAYYTGLPPRNYRFRVMAYDSAAPTQGSEVGLSLKRQPYFHQTPWFIAACAAAMIACAGLVFLFYARQTKARYALLLAERTRLAREMHDTVIQNCAGLSTLLEAAASTVGQSNVATGQLLDRARAHVKLTLDEARQSVWDLRQASLGSGLVSSLSEYTGQLSREKNIPIQTEISGTPAPLDEKTDRNLLLVAREALRNAVAHANPRQVNIRIAFEPGEVKLEVVDDGRGFQPPAELAPDTGCYGLVGMRERIEQLGGSFLLRSEPGRGTSVIANLPIARTQRA